MVPFSMCLIFPCGSAESFLRCPPMFHVDMRSKNRAMLRCESKMSALTVARRVLEEGAGSQRHLLYSHRPNFPCTFTRVTVRVLPIQLFFIIHCYLLVAFEVYGNISNSISLTAPASRASQRQHPIIPPFSFLACSVQTIAKDGT